jgi:hypothetical protein
MCAVGSLATARTASVNWNMPTTAAAATATTTTTTTTTTNHHRHHQCRKCLQ